MRAIVASVGLLMCGAAGCKVDALEPQPEFGDAKPLYWTQLVIIPDADARVRRSSVYDSPEPKPPANSGIETFRFDVRTGPLGDPILDLSRHTAVTTDPAAAGRSILAPALVTASVFSMGPAVRGHVVFVLAPENEPLDAVRVQGECQSAAAYGAMGCFALTDLPPESAALGTLLAPARAQGEAEGDEEDTQGSGEAGADAEEGKSADTPTLGGLLVWGAIDVQASTALAAVGEEVPLVASLDLPTQFDGIVVSPSERTDQAPSPDGSGVDAPQRAEETPTEEPTASDPASKSAAEREERVVPDPLEDDGFD